MITLGISRPAASRAARTSGCGIPLLTSMPANPASRTTLNRSRTLSFLAVGPFSVELMNAFFNGRIGLATGAAIEREAELDSAAARTAGENAASAADDLRKL